MAISREIRSTFLNLFLTSVETCAAYNGWDDWNKLVRLKLSLKGNTTHVLDGGFFPENVLL